MQPNQRSKEVGRRNTDMSVTSETKITMKVGLIAAGVSALIIFILNTLWVHSGDIVTLKTNQVTNIQNVAKMEITMEKVQIELSAMNANLVFITRTLTNRGNK
jgi:hypothetical protein